MKLIKCIVREHKVDETTDALKAINVTGITVTQVGGRGSHESTGVWRGGQFSCYLPQR